MVKALRTIEEYPIENLISEFDKMYPMKERISQAFNRFIKYNEEPSQFDCVRHDIAESWLRSRSFGVSMDVDLSKRKVIPSNLKRILKENQLLIDVVKPILLKDLAFLRHHSDFGAYLYDRNMINILGFNGREDSNFIGVDYSEQSIGTNSGTLSIFLDKPFMITPTENFNINIQHVSAAISVPIHNPEGDIIGTLTFAYPTSNNVYLVNRGMLSGMISLQMSLVKKIENKLKVVTQNHALFRAVSSITDDSLIAVNKHGVIQNMNGRAENLLGATVDNFKGTSITDVFENGKQVFKILNKSNPTEDISTHILTHRGKTDCAMRVVPFEFNDGGAIICLSQSKKFSANPCKDQNKTLNALYTLTDIIGTSPEFTRAKQIAEKFAATPLNILLLGESGTGKELFAHAIHNVSRPEGPFITINCASLPRGLVESEFFGFEGGTFTGADRRGRSGKLEMANGGTLFLDEIGDMPLGFQPILLRVLEDKRIMRIGGNHYVPTNFRVIAATNKDIKELIAQKLFREDLYYRLCSLKILIPSLKNRKSDILLLARHFIQKHCHEYNLSFPTIDPAVDHALVSYEWPGNIRELQNVICTAMSLAENGVIRVTDLPPEIINDSIDLYSTNSLKTIADAEKKAILEALTNTGFNIKKAALILGISRPTLYQKLKEYDICTNK